MDAMAFAHTPTGRKTWNLGRFCSRPQPEQTAETQPPLAADTRLFQLFVRFACSANNAQACVPLIGRCTILLVSSSRAWRCAVVSSGCCYRLPFVYIVRCVAVFDRSLLRIYLSKYELLRIDDMCDKCEGEHDNDPMIVDSSASSHDSPGPRGRGRARPSPGRMRPPFPLLDPSQLGYPREVTGLFGVPRVGPSNTGSAWPRPQAIAPAGSGVNSGAAMSAMGVGRPPVSSPEGVGPRPVLVAC